MREARAIFSTADVAGAERIGFWTKALGNVCSGLRTDGYGADTLDGRIKLANIGRLKLCDIAASRHRIKFSKDELYDARKSTIKIVYQLAGTSIYQQGGAELEVNPGDCIVYDASSAHAVINPEASHHLVVAVPKDLALLNNIHFDEIPLLRTAEQGSISGLTTTLVHSAINDICTIEPDREAELTDLILGLIRLSLPLDRHYQPRRSPRNVLNREIKRLIQLNLRDPEFSIKRLADTLGCSKRLLHQSFAAEGMTINEFLWTSRLEKCRHELECPPLRKRSITDIALSWGFNSSSHFSRSFKTRFGYTPSSSESCVFNLNRRHD